MLCIRKKHHIITRSEMKPIVAIFIYFSLMIPSLLLGFGKYAETKESIREDVNQALAKTILHTDCSQITADTLKTYRSNLKTEPLKHTSYLSLCTDEPSKITLCSDTMNFRSGNERLYIRAYPNCSNAVIFGISNQTIPSVLFAISIAWSIFSWVHLHRKKESILKEQTETQVISFGNLSYATSTNLFYSGKGEIVYFTPMQLALMKLLILSKNHRLSIEEICHNLWPKKENGRESLYSLIRRLKPIVESNSNVRISIEKGGYYALHAEKQGYQ